MYDFNAGKNIYFEDYDWEQDRVIKYRTNDKGGFDRLY